MKGLVILILAINIALASPGPTTSSQIKVPCGAASMVTSFIPCMSFLTNSNPNESLITGKCCQALRYLTSGDMDCFCFFLSVVVPFSSPIRSILDTYLPQVCGISDALLIQCKSTYGSLPPASGSLSPGQSPSTPSEIASLPHLKATSPAMSSTTESSSEAPFSDAMPLMNPTSSPSVVSNPDPSSIMASGGHSLLISSSYTLSPFLLIAFGLLVLKYY
ncbi:hypothetical protein K1719_014025 [Acacia pycnantha]|nr:hypothetical protein K1719_014025 [Acacia pycnantha]